VASLRATAGQLGLEPGSGPLASALGEASAAAARLLDTVIALNQVLEQAGSPQEARGPQPVLPRFALEQLADAAASLRRALAPVR
jgi:hypothetical protein